MSTISGLRQIKSHKIPDLLPSSLIDTDDKPEFEWVDPSDLYIEQKYQRNLTDHSIKLIRKIFKDFEWSKFKPPVVSRSENKWVVIDGQHTAIAAASHPKIKKIPVMVITSASVKDRANAFMGHNRDRLNVSPAQMFFSSVAAEDPVALIVKKAMDETGCTVVRAKPPIWVEGQTMAVGSLMVLATRKTLPDIVRILKILMDAKRAPIVAGEINAVADMLFNKEYAGRFTDRDLVTTIREKTPDAWRAWAEANIRKGQSMATKRALSIAWYRKVPKKRGRIEQPSK